jgi:hypothetical protein
MVTVEVASANPFPLSAPLKLPPNLPTIQSLVPVMIYVNNTCTVNINSYSFWTLTASIVSPFYIFPHRSNHVWFLNIVTIDVNVISILLLVSLGGFRLVFPGRLDRRCHLASLSLHALGPVGGSRGLSDGAVP